MLLVRVLSSELLQFVKIYQIMFKSKVLATFCQKNSAREGQAVITFTKEVMCLF